MSVLNTNTAPKLATSPAVTPTCFRGFDVPCLKCGEAGNLTIHLDCLDCGEAIRCGSCDAEYGLVDVETAVRVWSQVIAWISHAPILSE